LSPKTAVSYISRWRKENGVQRKYTRTNKESANADQV
jgi:hypothetical protein